MNSVVVDGEASETESEYSDSEEDIADPTQTQSGRPETVKSSPPLGSDQEQVPSDMSTCNTDTANVTEVNTSLLCDPLPQPPPSPSLTLFEENLRERNSIFSSSYSVLVNGYFDRVLNRIRFLNTDCKVLQVNVEKIRNNTKSTKSNLNRGINQLDGILAFPLLPER